MASQFMHMLNPYCGVDRDPRGVVRLTICNAGSLNILGSAAINGVREGLEQLATEPSIRAPVIARMPGWCLGGGLEFAAACDFRIAAQDARFGMPEVRVGIPSVIHAALLPRLIGWG